MTTALNSLYDEDLEITSGNGVASSSERPTQSSHNRACTNCVRAKAKCSIGIGVGEKCDRCYRMNKDCQPSPPVRKRRTVKKGPANKTAKLEEKLDGLVTLLKIASQAAPGSINVTSTDSPAESSGQSSHGSASGSSAPGIVGHSNYAQNGHLSNGSRLPGACFTAPSLSCFPESASVRLQPILNPALDPSPEEAELYLHSFRANFIYHIPFIVIPPSMTARRLRQERPLLWVCIMAAASTNSTQQIRLSREIRAIFGREAYVEATKSMDFLLAILVYAAWDRRYGCEKPLLTTLVQLAIAILYQLGLDKPPLDDPATMIAYELKGHVRPSRLTTTMEERRALLGCFLMSSISSSYLRRGDSLRWTAYSEECLRVIETQKECASDSLLAQLVKSRLMIERAMDAPWSNGMTELGFSTRPPAMFYFKSLEAQLQDFKSNIPSDLKDNKTLLMEIYNLEISIYGIGFYQAPGIFSGHPNARLSCLCACLESVKAWVELFHSIHPTQYVGFPIAIYTNMTRCFVGLYRLLTFEHPEWDRGLVRDSVDLASFLETTEKKFMRVKEEVGIDIGGSEDLDFFEMMAAKVGFIKKWFNATVGSTTPSLMTAPTDQMGDFIMGLYEDDWLRDLAGPWNNQWTS